MSYYTQASYHICFIFINRTLNFLPRHPSGEAQDGNFCGDQTSINKNTLNGWCCRSPLVELSAGLMSPTPISPLVRFRVSHNGERALSPAVDRLEDSAAMAVYDVVVLHAGCSKACAATGECHEYVFCRTKYTK